jgi:hypothetical protein
MRTLGIGLLALGLCGCAESQVALDDARSAVKSSGEELLRMYQVIDDGCREPPPAPAFCPELKRRFDAIQGYYTKINKSIP